MHGWRPAHLRELFGAWQGEAQECQRVMDELGRAGERDLVAEYYWRGRRDGFEQAAYELGYGRR